MNETEGEDDSSYKFFFDGIFMGLADIVPGVSGGTIAFILGIYERLISAIKSIDLKFIPFSLLSIYDRNYLEKARKNLFSIDFKLLLPLLLGIGSAILAASYVIDFALHSYQIYIHSFFFGLILISAWHIYGRIEGVNLRTFLPSVGGFTIAFLLVMLHESPGSGGFEIGPSLLYLLITGFFAFSAMILPGISGSLMAYLLGMYEYLLDVLHSIFEKWLEAGVFIIGGLLGLLSFSRIIYYFLENYRPHTLFFLTGLMMGALTKPFLEVKKALGPSADITTFVGIIIAGSIGAIIILLLDTYEN